MLQNPLFIHGWAFSSKIFQNFRGIKYDLPGHGRNRKPFKGFDEVLNELAEKTYKHHDVIGWSLGGSVALLFTLRFPEKVNRLFLIGTTPHFAGAWEEKNIKAMKLLIKKKGINAFRELAFGKFEDFFDEKSGFRLLDAYIKLNLFPYLQKINKEVYIIHGSRDKIVPLSEAHKLYKSLKNAKLIILGGGHFPVRNEEELKAAILKSGEDL
ncbi:alpha/beta fold hydrolase [Aquifex sp.]